MTEVLGMIQSIPNQKLMWSIESHESRLVIESIRNPLVQQGANLERATLPITDYMHQTNERPAGIENVHHQQHILTFHLSLMIEHQPHRPA